MVLWWIGNAVLLLVVLPVVIFLLNRVLAAVERIRGATDRILAGGVDLVGELSGVPEAVRLLLVGSNSAVRRGFELLLSGEPGVQIVGRAENASSAIRLGRELAPSTVLIDLESLGEGGLEEAAEVRVQIPATVIVLSLRDDQQSRHQAAEAGLRFVSKQAGSDGLLALLREGPVD